MARDQRQCPPHRPGDRTRSAPHRVHRPVTSIIAADGYVWAASGSGGLVAKIDPSEDRIAATARLHGWLQDLAVGGGYVWVSFIPDGHVFMLAEDDLSELQSYAAAPSPQTLAYGGRGLWITDPDANTVSFLDATTDHRSTFGSAHLRN